MIGNTQGRTTSPLWSGFARQTQRRPSPANRPPTLAARRSHGHLSSHDHLPARGRLPSNGLVEWPTGSFPRSPSIQTTYSRVVALASTSNPGSDSRRFSPDEPRDERELVNQIVRGDNDALAELFWRYRPRLWRMVNFRLHPRLKGRIDPDDVLQDAWMNAVKRIEHFTRDASRSCFVWCRMIVEQTLIDLHRRHLGTEKRDAARESSIFGGWNSDATSSLLAIHLVGQLTSPSSVVGRAEVARQLDVALQGMNEIDREVLVLRHFEELTNSETALVLNLTEQAASARYVRALGRLKQLLETLPGFDDVQNSNGHS